MSRNQGHSFTCSITGATLQKGLTFKFVLSPDGVICFDIDFCLPGKSVYVSNGQEYFDKWHSAGFFLEFLGTDLGSDKVLQQMLNQYHNKILTFIALAKKSGRVRIGKKQVEQYKGASSNSLIVQAVDASKREKYSEVGLFKILEIFTIDEISKILGGDNVVYCLVEGEFAQKIEFFLENYKKLKDYNDRQSGK